MMRSRIRRALVLFGIAAAMFAPAAADAASCPAPTCITLGGTVVGPAGEGVPHYNISFQRADGYSATTVSNASGTYSITLPAPANATQCYQVAGQADQFYAHSNIPAKLCVSTPAANLNPLVRTSSFSGAQKVYIPDTGKDVSIPVEVQSLSRTYPAAFDGMPMPWELEHEDPFTGTHEHGYEVGGRYSYFPDPTVTKIADGVWKYSWKKTLHIEAGRVGMYEFEWGRMGSAYNPMMECRMIWFGYGIDQMSPRQSALPGQSVTLSGRSFGSVPGTVRIKSTEQNTVITGSSIVEWTDTSVTIALPANAKTGYIWVEPPGGLPTNQIFLVVDPAKALQDGGAASIVSTALFACKVASGVEPPPVLNALGRSAA